MLSSSHYDTRWHVWRLEEVNFEADDVSLIHLLGNIAGSWS